MQVALRRLIVISAISLGGATVGLALGHFVAGQPKMTGLEELASYNQALTASEDDSLSDPAPDQGFASRSGPTSYTCEGCDAHLYNDMISGNAMAADTTPLPPYRPLEGVAVAPPLRMPAAAARPQAAAIIAAPARNVIIPPDRPKAVPQPILESQQQP